MNQTSVIHSMRTRWFSPMAVVVLAWVVCTGCTPADHHVDADEEHHADHFMPPHLPTDLAAARLRMQDLCLEAENNEKTPTDWRSVALARGAVSPQQLESLPTTALDELIDLVDWLPRLAADSDLPEKAWNDLVERSEAAAAALKQRRMEKSTTLQANAYKPLEMLLDLLDEFLSSNLHDAAAAKQPSDDLAETGENR